MEALSVFPMTRARFSADGNVAYIGTSVDASDPHCYLYAAGLGSAVSGTVTLQAVAQNVQPITFTFQQLNTAESFSRTVTLNADGTFVLEDIPAGNYSVRVKGTKWLARAVAVNTTTATSPG